jgi:hypothetical protein
VTGLLQEMGFVPVTAKLSKRFYEVLGEDVANELVDWFNQVDATYRGDLRELNEHNFARFDAKLEQRVVQLDAKIDRMAAGLDAKIDRVAAELDAKIDRVAAELRGEMQSMEARIEASLRALKADLLKWMFGAWATLLGAMIALIKLG